MKKIDSLNFYKDIGKRIAHFRKEQNWSQAEFAQRLGVKQQVIASYEIAKNRIQVSFLVRVANELFVDVEDLLGSKKTKKSRSNLIPKLKRCIEEIEKLPVEKQKIACDVLTSIIRN